MNNNSQILNADILKINSLYPIIFSEFINDIAYEWFYIEIVKNNFHIVLIISIKDPFQKNIENKNSSSIYLTWFQDNVLVSYSYSFYDKNELLIKNISDWVKNKNNVLELWVPDYSLLSFIHLVIENPFCCYSEVNENDIKNISSKKHYWQFLRLTNECQGYIEKINLPKNFDLNKYANRGSKFYDALLSAKLKNKQVNKKILNGAQIYIDHNAGVEPLYTIKKNWFWWHVGDSSNYEICYYFPDSKAMYYISGDLNSSKSEILYSDNNFVTIKKSISFFGLVYPKKLKSPKFDLIYYKKLLESAPFYLRCKSVEGYASTLEVMNPNKIMNKFNQVLLLSRKIYIKKNIKSLDDISTELSFNEICSLVTKINGKSFFVSSFILSNIERINSYFIYTICRLIDDATDELSSVELKNEKGTFFSKKLLSVLWDSELDLNKDFLNSLKSNLQYCTNYVIGNKSLINFIIKSREFVKNLNIEKKYFEELIVGQNMDENFSQPKNFNDLNIYCFRVAGVVGILMAKIFKIPNNNSVYTAAEKLGIAMQITNILRDIKEDFERDRIYIPVSLFDKFGIQSSDLKLKLSKKCVNYSFLYLISDLSQYAISCYKSAYDGVKFIPSFRSRLCVKFMIAIYGSILGKILINKMIVFKKRVVVSKFSKIVICIKVILGFHPLRIANLKGEKKLYEKF